MCICAYHLISICCCCPWICTSIVTSSGGVVQIANMNRCISEARVESQLPLLQLESTLTTMMMMVIPESFKRINKTLQLSAWSALLWNCYSLLAFLVAKSCLYFGEAPAVDIIDELQFDLLCGWYISLCYLPLGVVHILRNHGMGGGGHYVLIGCPIKMQKCLKKCGMVPKSAEWWQGSWKVIFFLPVIENYRFQSKLHQIFWLQCHLAAAFFS